MANFPFIIGNRKSRLPLFLGYVNYVPSPYPLPQGERGMEREGVTMSFEQITPQQAKEILDQNSDAIYVDVRSIPEFERGHPQGAINIPIFHYEAGGMRPNPDFSKVVEAVLSKEKTLVVGCQAGGRSQQACQVLGQAGFQNLYNVMGGFGGGRNPETGEPIAGWAQQGLPVSQENGEGVGYESLLRKV